MALRHPSLTDGGLLNRQPLPNELIVEIFLRLPVRTLMLFKCVCKSWKTLISDPQFAKSHLKSLTVNPSITHQRSFCSTLTSKISSFDVKPLLENPSEPTKPVEFSMEHRFHILGSCNGLLCLFDEKQGYVKLWNPLIRLESKKYPTIDSYGKRMWLTYNGFGYDHINDKYKVLVVLRMEILTEIVTKIYTFGENSWKTIQNFPCRSLKLDTGKFVSGTLNWVIVKRGDSDSYQAVILSFDIQKETYNKVLPLPETDGVKASYHVLGVLNNCLFVCIDANKTHWDIWLMKKYGVVESWTRLMIIPHEQLRHRVNHNPTWPCFSMVPLIIVENRIVLLSTTCTKIFLYNLNNGRLDDCLPGYSTPSDQHIYYYESLVSPHL